MSRFTIFTMLALILFSCNNDDSQADQLPVNPPLKEVDLINVSGTGNPSSAFVFPLSSVDDVTIDFEGNPQIEYVIEGSNNLKDWETLYVLEPNSNNTTSVGSTVTRSYAIDEMSMKFCRVRQIPQIDAAGETIIVHIKYHDNLKIVKFNGDSLTVGGELTNTGSVPNLFQADFSNYIVVNDAINGQGSSGILSRSGAIPVTISVEGNAFSGTTLKRATSSQNLLFTPADSDNRSISGMVNNKPAILSYTGGDYFLQSSNVSVTDAINPGSLFIPFAATNYKEAVNIYWIGRNDTDYELLLSRYDQALSMPESPKRFIVIGILLGLNEPGTDRFSAIKVFNNSLKSHFPDNYVDATPPTTAEMAAIGYKPTQADLEDISQGVFPEGMRSDVIHLNNYGYEIIENRLEKKFIALGY
ncbi:hypothetical protein [Flavobacterium psychrotrophum]|uniref:hypothetical protein n=1 Tax=Flavobacterium psychrotrophum TaxID=2294119 RepID=UPI0013C535B8|nr:hypothetical protein [Flavobacterium psychrotrophum]